MQRNSFLEMDGLFFESETHEWFNDDLVTRLATTENAQGVSIPNIKAFVVRNKETGEYDRVIVDGATNSVVYDSKSYEQICFWIGQQKLIKHFNANT